MPMWSMLIVVLLFSCSLLGIDDIIYRMLVFGNLDKSLQTENS